MSYSILSLEETVMKSKEVSNFELFYDLIFAYAISRITSVLHIINSERIPVLDVAEFLMMMLVFWTIWTYQTVFANRFYHTNLSHVVFLVFNMFWVVILSQSINTNFEQTHATFAGATSVLFMSLAVQYLIQAKRNKSQEVRHLCIQLGSLLTSIAVIGALTMIQWGNYGLRFSIYAITIFMAAFVPIGMKKTLRHFPTHFDHLTERYNLFTIILFGESIISVAGTIDSLNVHIDSLLFFIIIALLFSIYILTYDLGINRHLITAGLVLIHAHYFVFVGIELITASLELFMNQELTQTYFIWLLIIGLFFFLVPESVVLFVYGQKGRRSAGNVFFILAGFFVLLGIIANFKVEISMIYGLIALSILVLCYLWWRVLLRGQRY
ncbi:low temperature requirement protein A [Lentilactobacillus hilgardii]|uniref:Low temperature requirement protein A n=2 Tax=Lentilactobacillus hilgardii TaxID=1588 RepID=A0A6P1E803_LENHI|nr:low temperature requirement protein LtrA [Lentilactobacillus hilgardii ATCC 27305]MCT3392136.1 low temperature requirement protein A [Lentilactobacillus hilgardii]QHB50833.1 low temperature requirement protein A [Lentilactobacillus hilgardii]RRG11498.1 MAG: low temperature requirement protein A [Lactobacillus sp.]